VSIDRDEGIRVGRGKHEPNEYSSEWLSFFTDEKAVCEYAKRLFAGQLSDDGGIVFARFSAEIKQS
jgi:hypothetical protein